MDKKKIVVAMSGGVDSSVVACMLKEQGYEVIGITLQLYDSPTNTGFSGKTCCAGVDIEDARNVALQHDFPHYVLNYQSKFKEAVIDNFVETYLSGETPIPCVRCNQSVKFNDLMKVAIDLKADALATGHYLQRIETSSGIEMHEAIDKTKDQSYFLFATTKIQLDFLRFPLGNMTKEQTRIEAQKFKLKIANKSDSQDICFVPDGNYAKVIEKYQPKAFKQGFFKHIETNETIGTHEGIIKYTIGQRRGIGIAYKEPLFVIKIDPKENVVYVGEEKFLKEQEFYIEDINWLADEIDMFAKNDFQVKIRSSAEKQDAKILIFKNENDKLIGKITMKEQIKSITPGQACVIYDKTRIVGGGFIFKK